MVYTIICPRYWGRPLKNNFYQELQLIYLAKLQMLCQENRAMFGSRLKRKWQNTLWWIIWSNGSVFRQIDPYKPYELCKYRHK